MTLCNLTQFTDSQSCEQYKAYTIITYYGDNVYTPLCINMSRFPTSLVCPNSTQGNLRFVWDDSFGYGCIGIPEFFYGLKNPVDHYYFYNNSNAALITCVGNGGTFVTVLD